MSFDSKEPFIAPESHPLRRRVTNTLGFVLEENEPMRRHAFPRAMTEPIANAINFITDTDGEWTRNIIEDLDKIDDKGPDGDVPVQPAFAQDKYFWTIAGLGVAMGLFTGLFSLGFMNLIDEVPKLWVDNGEFDTVDDCWFYNGEKYWIAIVGGTGFVVGFARWLFSFPDDLPGFFKEVTSCHVDYKHVPMTVALSGISIAGGASLGPEQALGALGGGVATWLCEKLKFENEENEKLLVLTGMSAAMGAVFPTPVLGILMIHELGEPPRSFMESTLLMSIGGIVSFLVFYSLENDTYIEHLEASYRISANWEFELRDCWMAVIIGLMSSLISLLSLITIGICKQLLMRIEEKCKARGLPGKIIVCTIGGLCIGTVNWALPLTVGNGNQTLKSLIRLSPDLPLDLLMSTAFARMFNLGVSMNCGFIGGFIFPMFTIGVIVGVMAHNQYPDVPLGLTVACFLAGVPSGICPMPFTMLGIACFIFFLGLTQTVPVFISCIVAYTVFTGLGIFGALTSRGAAGNQTHKHSHDRDSEVGKRSDLDEPVEKYHAKPPRGGSFQYNQVAH